jgi:hypothetical protein
MNDQQTFAPKTTHGFGFGLDLYGFVRLGLGWASSTQPKPKTVGSFGCKYLMTRMNEMAVISHFILVIIGLASFYIFSSSSFFTFFEFFPC